MDRGTALQFLAYYSAVGPNRFAKGPHEVVMQFVFLCNMKELTACMVLSQGQVGWLVQLIRVFDPENRNNYVNTFLKNVNTIRLWIYSALVNIS